MAEDLTNQPATPSVLMQLREERQVMREGYRFLDEKRLLLAAETMRRLEQYEELAARFAAMHREAAEALASATAFHGLDGLQVYPAESLDEAEVATRPRNFLGVTLVDAKLRLHEDGAPQEPALPSEEARVCRERFRALIEAGAELASLHANLERLLAEYRRTQRRARALEDVLLPEIDSALHRVSERLEELDQEEAIRVRR